MVLRRIVYALLNKAEVVEKLAESRPIRRAAQITVFALTKAQLAGRDATSRLLRSQTLRQIRAETELGRKVTGLRDTFMKELKDGVRDAARQIKERK